MGFFFRRNNLYIGEIDNFTCLEFNFSHDLITTSIHNLVIVIGNSFIQPFFNFLHERNHIRLGFVTICNDLLFFKSK